MVENLSQLTLFGVPLVDFHSFGYLFLKLSINMVFTLLIVKRMMCHAVRDDSFLFTAIVVNLVVFLICFFLINIQLGGGFAFGLFAILSIIRYRTEDIPIKQMTYIFTVIVIAVINSLSGKTVSLTELLLANSVIAGSIYFLERGMAKSSFSVKTVKYEKLELIKPEKYLELLQDLKERTGFSIYKAVIGSINLSNNTVELKIFYK